MKSINLNVWRLRFVIVIVVAGCCLLLTLTTVNVGAVAGDLDGTFGTGGMLTTQVTNGHDYGYAIALQNDGKIVVAGDANQTDFAVTRYNVDGTLDLTFDVDGIVVTDIVGQAESGRALVIQDDGKIIVVGEAGTGAASDFAVVRYNTDGSLDTGFNSDGKVTTDIGTFSDGARAVALQDDGKIVVAGQSDHGAIDFDFAVVRYNSNGDLDSTFGSGGKFTIDMGSNFEGANGVAIQSDGKIILAGESRTPAIVFALARCDVGGSLDLGFGVNGKVLTSINGNFDRAYAVAVQNDGKIVAAGTSKTSPFRFAAVRYNADGSLDSSFGSGGKVTTGFNDTSDSVARALFIQGDGKIVLGGNGTTSSIGSNFALARYNSNGSLDTTFGDGGKVTTPIGTSSDGISGVALQSDGRIVAAGNTFVGSGNTEFAVARYDGGALYMANRRFDFDGDGISDLGVYRPSTNYWYVLNSATSTITALEYSLPTDKLAPADYNGDGRTDIAYLRDGFWSIYNGGGQIQFGQAGDLPVPGDFDGDGLADLAVFRQGSWYVRQSRNGAIGFAFGSPTDKAVPDDYDGDGKFDPAVYRDGVWYIRKSTGGVTGVQFGLSTDRPVPADYDGDSKADVAVYRDGIWYVLGSTSGFQAAQFGLSTDIPVPADYDGDAKADFAVYREGVWYILRSSDSVFAFQYFGLAGDVPLESAYAP